MFRIALKTSQKSLCTRKSSFIPNKYRTNIYSEGYVVFQVTFKKLVGKKQFFN